MDSYFYIHGLYKEFKEESKSAGLELPTNLDNSLNSKLHTAYYLGCRNSRTDMYTDLKFVEINSICWKKFNYGAIQECDFQSNFAKGEHLTYEKVLNIMDFYFRLPSRLEIEDLCKNSDVSFVYNIGSDSRTWNQRAIFKDKVNPKNYITFYCNGNNLNLGIYFCRIWLSDKCQDKSKALTAIIKMKEDSEEEHINRIGDWHGKIMSIDYEEYSKDKAADAHFIVDISNCKL